MTKIPLVVCHAESYRAVTVVTLTKPFSPPTLGARNDRGTTPKLVRFGVTPMIAFCRFRRPGGSIARVKWKALKDFLSFPKLTTEKAYLKQK
jgi:hypothetical protein